LQYYYGYLLRKVQDLEKEFPDAIEVTTFISTVASQLALAMGLRAQPMLDPQFYRQAAVLKAQIITSMESLAHHLGIRRIQEIFRTNTDRLYHWVDDLKVAAGNNLAEHHLCPRS